MLEFLGNLIINCFLSAVVGVAILFIVEGCGGGGIVIRGTKKYDKVNRNADAKVKEIMKNGSGSSKAELQGWWDTYHSK